MENYEPFNLCSSNEDVLILSFFFLNSYGLFSQTSTSDSSLIPSSSAKLLDNGIDMIEFLGRVVGKALYEGFYWTIVFHMYLCKNFYGAIVFWMNYQHLILSFIEV
jgi:hypothetical protein